MFRVEGARDSESFSFTVDGGVAFSGVEVFYEALQMDSTCPDGARGVLHLRDPSGGWFRLDLEDDCGACGALSFEGEPLDELLCLDFSPFFAAYDALELP
jgi:hypothetical protein